MQRKVLNYVVWGLTAALYSPILYQLYKGRWDLVDYTHAYFILPISLWLVWRSRDTFIKIGAVSPPTKWM